MFHPKDDAISIMHHGRDRGRLLPRVYEGHQRSCGNHLLPHEQFKFARQAAKVLETLQQDTFIQADSILRYLDLDLVDSPEFIFDHARLVAAVEEVRAMPEALTQANRDWLLGRGVTPGQLSKFRDIRQLTTREARIVLGAEIHPALQRWVGTTTPEGVLWPWTLGHGTYVRLLSTVPKLKFGASVPLLHVGTNLGQLPCPDKGYLVWLVEGLFDGLALDSTLQTFCTPSSGTWSELQLFTLVSLLRQHHVAGLVVAHDNDRVGHKENLFLWSVLRQWWPVHFVCYPKGVKDMSELICRDGCHPRSLKFSNPEQAAEAYLALPSQGVVDFDIYLDHRQASYSNDRYQWQVASGR